VQGVAGGQEEGRGGQEPRGGQKEEAGTSDTAGNAVGVATAGRNGDKFRRGLNA